MQTFLPYPSFADSAAALDARRLNKQRIEGLQILRILARVAGYLPPVSASGRIGYAHHPAVLAWRGHARALAQYVAAVCGECDRRGIKDKIKAVGKLAEVAALFPAGEAVIPAWVGDSAYHLAHRSNLVRKDTGFYGALWPDCPADLEYVWPVRARRDHVPT